MAFVCRRASEHGDSGAHLPIFVLVSDSFLERLAPEAIPRVNGAQRGNGEPESAGAGCTREQAAGP